MRWSRLPGCPRHYGIRRSAHVADKNRSRRDCAHDRHVVWRYVDHAANKIHGREQGPLDSCASRCREEDGRESRFDLRQLLVRQVQYVYKSAYHSILIRIPPPRVPMKQSYEPAFCLDRFSNCDAIVTAQIVIDRSPLLSSLPPFSILSKLTASMPRVLCMSPFTIGNVVSRIKSAES